MAGHITFDDAEDELKKIPSNGGEGSSQPAHGVYNLRQYTSLRRRSSLSLGRPPTSERVQHDEDEEESGLRRTGDYKTKQIFHGTQLLYLAYQSIGVIYGDIGTSPLYVFSGTFSADPSYDDLVGVLSLVIWSLLMMVTLKYVIVILHADNDGEGGTFSTYSLLARFAHIAERDPREASLIRMERYQTNDFGRTNRGFRAALEKSKVAKAVLKVMGVLAVTMVMSDGVLTPAQSVLGAVQGLNVVAPNITDATVVGTTCGILVLLFAIQPFGTSKLAVCFAPIVIVWLGFNAGFGIYNLVEHDYSVLKAFNPGYAFSFLARNGEDGWRALGGVLLSFTGVEALFADLGAFSMRAIQLSWLCYCLPCLLLAYIGQAAYISQNPDAWSNPLYNSVPPGMLIPTLIIAILAAIVASQAIITATFQLLAQIMKLSFFPQIKVVHTSKVYHGQLYVPLANWLLMIGTVIIAAVYNNTTSLGNAYGVCVMFVTFFDTCMVSLAAILVWKVNPIWVFLPWLTIASMDGAFLSSALTKVPDGAWFTITLAAVLASVLILWRFGKENQWKAEAADRFPMSYIVKKTKDGETRLTDAFGGSVLSQIKGFGIFFDKAGEKAPLVFSQFVSKLLAVTDVTVFFHLRPLETPSVAFEDRYTVSRMAIPGCYRLVVRHGYNDEIITSNLASLVCEQVRDFIVRNNRSNVTIAPLSGSELSSSDDAGEVIRAHQVIEGEDVITRPTTSAANEANEEKDEDEPKPTSTNGKSSSVSISGPLDGKPMNDVHIANSVGSTEKFPAREHVLDDSASEELRKLEAAFARQTLYIVGKEQLRVSADTGIFRKILLNTFIWIRENTRTKIANLRVPTDKVIEVGFVKDM